MDLNLQIRCAVFFPVKRGSNLNSWALTNMLATQISKGQGMLGAASQITYEY